MTLRLEGVSRVVGGETYLADIDLELQPGSINLLLGPTLSGKTSLMRLMAGLDRPSQGRVLVDGQDVTGRSVRKRDVAMVYQQFINYPAFTVFDNIAAPLRRAGLAKAEVEARVRKAAASLRIEPLLGRLPDELSGGQQQRTALARALVRDAGLLLLDEPLVNLDYKLREELREELREIFKSRRSIVVYATTEPVEALMMGGNTVVLHEGRVLQAGATVEVYQRPASVRVGQTFSDPPMNLVDGRVEGGEAVLGAWLRVPLGAQLSGLGEGRYRFGVRANHLFVSRQSPADIEFTAPVALAEISGSETFLHVDLGTVSWVAQEEGVHPMALGEELSLFLDPRHLFAFGEDGHLIAAPRRGAAPLAAQ